MLCRIRNFARIDGNGKNSLPQGAKVAKGRGGKEVNAEMLKI
jgi:hypothetical protein